MTQRAEIPAELIDCPGVIGAIPDRTAPPNEVATFLANNIPALVECGGDAGRLRALNH